jgi:hypothetical protein
MSHRSASGAFPLFGRDRTNVAAGVTLGWIFEDER